MDIKEKIIGFMKESAYRPLSIKELVKKFSVPKEERDSFKRLVKDMAESGALIKVRGSRYGLPARMNLITGALECHPKGFGFVSPEDGGGGRADDLFIGRGRFKGAMHGDKVCARIEKKKRDGKVEGSIIRVLERANKSIVGVFTKNRGFSAVVPSTSAYSKR